MHIDLTVGYKNCFKTEKDLHVFQIILLVLTVNTYMFLCIEYEIYFNSNIIQGIIYIIVIFYFF